jgi:hypothetical protein
VQAAIAADFGLDPADALRHLATTAVHVAQLARGPAQDDFIDAMAREVRYYNKEKMLKAHTVLRSVAPVRYWWCARRVCVCVRVTQTLTFADDCAPLCEADRARRGDSI